MLKGSSGVLFLPSHVFQFGAFLQTRVSCLRPSNGAGGWSPSKAMGNVGPTKKRPPQKERAEKARFWATVGFVRPRLKSEICWRCFVPVQIGRVVDDDLYFLRFRPWVSMIPEKLFFGSQNGPNGFGGGFFVHRRRGDRSVSGAPVVGPGGFLPTGKRSSPGNWAVPFSLPERMARKIWGNIGLQNRGNGPERPYRGSMAPRQSPAGNWVKKACAGFFPPFPHNIFFFRWAESKSWCWPWGPAGPRESLAQAGPPSLPEFYFFFP